MTLRLLKYHSYCLANAAVNIVIAPKIGRLIHRFGERKALIFEYVGLTFIFAGYAFVESSYLAVFLYIADHLFFSIAIALKTYFQKIADPADIASSAGVSFTINHIAAVFIPVVFGLVWLYSPSLVFLAGAGMAIVSLLLALNMPAKPAGNEVLEMKYYLVRPQLVFSDNYIYIIILVYLAMLCLYSKCSKLIVMNR